VVRNPRSLNKSKDDFNLFFGGNNNPELNARPPIFNWGVQRGFVVVLFSYIFYSKNYSTLNSQEGVYRIVCQIDEKNMEKMQTGTEPGTPIEDSTLDDPIA